MAAGVTCCSPEKNHPWWSHPSGVHLGNRFQESVGLVRVPYGTVRDGDSNESLSTPENLSARAYTTEEHLVSQCNDTAAQKECKNDIRRYSSQPHTLQEASTVFIRIEAGSE